jgi:hypothetical protein
MRRSRSGTLEGLQPSSSISSSLVTWQGGLSLTKSKMLSSKARSERRVCRNGDPAMAHWATVLGVFIE